MQKIVILILISMCSIAGFSQDTIKLREMGRRPAIVTDRPPQAVYFQLGGSGPIISVNYDRRFSNRVNGFGFAAGIGFWAESDFYGSTSMFSIPVSLNYLIGRRNDFVELAAGTTYISANATIFDDNDHGSGFIHHVNVGYRHQPATGGFFFRGGVSPLFFQSEYHTSFYLGFGYNF